MTPDTFTSFDQALSMKYFEIANVIVAFHIAQSILFLNALHKQRGLVDAICRARAFTFLVLIISTVAYCVALYGCAYLQIMLIPQDTAFDLARSSACFACWGRISIAIVLACISGLVFWRIRPSDPAAIS